MKVIGARMAGDWVPLDDDPEKRVLRQRLVELRQQHHELDEQVDNLQGAETLSDQMQLMRLKRKRLQLRDEIQWVESKLRPDIIA